MDVRDDSWRHTGPAHESAPFEQHLWLRSLVDGRVQGRSRGSQVRKAPFVATNEQTQRYVSTSGPPPGMARVVGETSLGPIGTRASHHAFTPSRCPENPPALVGCRVRVKLKHADLAEAFPREMEVQP
jgi:hypothetical protein